MQIQKLKLVLLSTSVLLSLLGCKSTTVSLLQEKSALNFESVVCQKWVGGQPGVSGTTVKLYPAFGNTVTPDSLYFEHQVSKIRVISTAKEAYWVAHYSNANPKDRKMCINTQDEYGNRPPVINKIPFVLKENEAMLSYFVGKQKFYYKIEDLVREETLYYP